MYNPNLKLIPISKETRSIINTNDIDVLTKYLLPHPTPFWEFWNLEEEFKCPFVSLANIYKEEGLVKPELLVAKEGVNYEDAVKHIELIISPAMWIIHSEVGVRAGSHLLSMWFTEESVKSELARLLGDTRGQ